MNFRSNGGPGAVLCLRSGMPGPIPGAKIFIAVLPVWNSTLQGREGSISRHRLVKVFHPTGNRHLLPVESAEIGRQAIQAGWRPGPSTGSNEAAGGEV